MTIFTAVAEPNRRWILDRLSRGPASVSDLVLNSHMSQPAMSKHLRALRDANLVTVIPEGQRRVYHINTAPLEELDAWLMPYRKFWSQKIDDLETHLANMEHSND